MVTFLSLLKNWRAILLVTLFVSWLVSALTWIIMEMVASYWKQEDQTKPINQTKSNKWGGRSLFFHSLCESLVYVLIAYFVCIFISEKNEIIATLLFVAVVCFFVWGIKKIMNNYWNEINNNKKINENRETIKKIVQKWVNEQLSQQQFKCKFLVGNEETIEYQASYPSETSSLVELDLNGTITLPITGGDINADNELIVYYRQTDPSLSTCIQNIQKATGETVNKFAIVTWDGQVPVYEVFSGPKLR